MPIFKKTVCTSLHDGPRWVFLLFFFTKKLDSRKTGIMSRTGINQKEIVVRKFSVDRSIPNFIQIRQCFER